MSAIVRWFLSERPADSHVSELESSLDWRVGVHRLRKHKFGRGEMVHFGFLSCVFAFVLISNPLPLLLKLAAACMLAFALAVPLTSQFFLHSLPILAWLGLYFTSSYIPGEQRPPITVKVLPAIETILYGDNLSDILATSTNTFLDILAWLPYGIFHFGAPFVVAIILFLFGPPTILRGYGFAFGYMNLFGVIMQNVFPAAPPWYKILYGLESAHYGMHGSPGGLGRIDNLFGINLYTAGFSNSSVIFGAFPSLHSGCATMEALFFSYCFPQLKPLFIFYVCWLWWSTMYLTHHYFVDLMAGSVLSYTIFQYTKYNHLPVVDTTLLCRWSYESVETYDVVKSNPLNAEQDIADIENVPLTDFDMEFELNANTTFEEESSVSPSIFGSSHSISRSSATSNTSLGELQPEFNAASRFYKQRYEYAVE